MHGSPPSQRILLHGSGVWARYNSAMRAIEAVVFDIGGVVQESPLHAIARYERDHGLPPGAINRAVVAAGEAGAWARLERGELVPGALRGGLPRLGCRGRRRTPHGVHRRREPPTAADARGGPDDPRARTPRGRPHE